MVTAIHLRGCRIAIPQFPDGRRTMLSHITPRRIFLIGSKHPCDIRTSHSGKGMHQPSCTDNPGSDGTLINDSLHDVFLHLLFHIGVIYHSEIIRQQICRDGVVTIVGTVWIQDMSRYGRRSFLDSQELSVKRLLRCFCLLVKPMSIPIHLLHTGISCHHLTDSIIISGGYQSHIRLACWILTMNQFLFLGRHTPVAILSTMDQSILLILVLQMLQPAFHIRVVFPQRHIVAIVTIKH